MHVHLGVDSTDSLTKGMCTTYLGIVLTETLIKKGIHFTDYPHLIRLNPNIPYKTRGNGAVALQIDAAEHQIQEIFAVAQKIVEDMAVFSDPQTNPGIALLKGDIPHVLHTFYNDALHTLLTVKDAYKTAEKVGAQLKGYKNERGVIGALASIGEPLNGDHTYELLAYREKRKWGKERHIDPETVIKMDKKIKDVFFNYDYQENTVCIAPHSVCPVLVGIRGETAESVINALPLVDTGEPVSKYVVYRTNQHTNFHFEKVSAVQKIADYSSVIVEGTVASHPVTIQGGHIFFEIENKGRIFCAAFEPTKAFRDIVRKLIPGDFVRVYGGVKPEEPGKMRAINLERMDIIELKTFTYRNPRCPSCGKSMTSKGKGKGFQCKKCKTTKEDKEEIQVDRTLSVGTYEPPPSAWRHLYKMTARKRTNKGKSVIVPGWIKY